MSLTTFSIVQRALDATEVDPDHEGLPVEVIIAGRVQKAVQSVVDCLVDPRGGKYEVSFADISTAATSHGARKIIVSSKPLRDTSLTLVEKAVVIATFAAHEIGHTVLHPYRGTIVKDHNPKSGYHAVANVADDIILEPMMADAYPILEDAFEFTGLWVLRTTRKDLPCIEAGAWDTTAARFNSLLSATRYGDIPDIRFVNAKARDERDWGRDWARRLIALRLSDGGGFIALCDEAWLRLRTKDDDEVEDPEPGGDEPEPTDEDGEEPEPPEGGCEFPVGSGEDDEDGDPEPGDDDGGDETEPGGDEPGGEDGDGDDDDEDGDPKPGGTPGGDIKDPNDQPRDWDDDPKPTDMDGDPLDDGDKGKGGGGAKDNPDGPTDPEVRDEDDFNPRDVNETTHEQADGDGDWAAKDTEAKVATYNKTTRTAFATHGAMATTWD